MRDATLVLLVKDEPPSEILLGLKKAGFATGKWNGFGGKIEPGESPVAAAARELYEEVSIRVERQDLAPVAYLDFAFPARPEWDQKVHVFLARQWEGEPVESVEMRPHWFAIGEIPKAQMWQDDQHWLPLVLAGKKVKARFVFAADNESIANCTIEDWK